eukprot:g4219.t1
MAPSVTPEVEVVVAPPATYTHYVRQALNSSIQVSSQNSWIKGSGAYTGECNVDMLKDAGCTYTIVGHSERRSLLDESNDVVAQKALYAMDNGLNVIACIGESLDERDGGSMESILTAQVNAYLDLLKTSEKAESHLNTFVIAYEPVWAIGTGVVATPEQVYDTHKFLRTVIEKTCDASVAKEVRIQYGGSVNAKNCQTLADLEGVDGFLVGGASLKPEFVDICKSGL